MAKEKNNNPRSQSSMTAFPNPEQIRQQAEQKGKIMHLPDLESMAPEEIRQIIYEMQINQTEAGLEIKQLRDRLEEKQDLDEIFRIVTANMLDMVSLTDMEGRFLFAGKSHSILGYEPDFLIGKSAMDFVHPEDIPYMLKEFSEFVASGHPRRVEYRHRRKDGTYLWFETVGNFIKDKNGSPQKIVFSSRDITIRKQAEKANEKDRAYLSAVIENIGDAIVICNAKGQIIRFNETARRLHGLPEQPITADQWAQHYDLYQEDGITPLPTEKIPLFRALQGELVQNAEIVVAPKHRSPYYLVCNGQSITDEAGNITGAVIAMHDISKRKKVEQQLRESKEKYRMLVENLHEVIYTVDEKGKITYVSPSVEAASGYSPSELLGKHFVDFVHPDDRRHRLKPFHKILSGMDSPSEYRYLTKNKEVIWIRTIARPLLKEGRVIGLQGVLIDITERKKAQEQRDSLQTQLRQLQKMEAIGTLAGGIAHDFNNILSSVLGYTELSLDMVEKGSLLHQNLSQVLTAGNRAKDLVRQILVFGRKENQQFTHTPIVPLIKEVLKMLRSTFPSFIEIRENIRAYQGTVYADANQLYQVIVNLGTNAKQAMIDEGGILDVSVETVSFEENMGKEYPGMTPGNYVCITLKDTGVGISEQYLDKIFEPYFTTSKTGTGTGLGLSVVHSIVQAHNGHITVYSEPRQGTTFCVYLPLAEQEGGRVETTVQEDEVLPKGIKSVLLVDDENSIVEMLKQVLEIQGYKVIPKTSSLEALDAFRASPDKFDIVITDMTMPYMTGDKLALKIKEIRPDVPVLLCTGFSEKINAQKKEDLDIEGVMIKPVTKADFIKMVRKILYKSANN